MPVSPWLLACLRYALAGVSILMVALFLVTALRRLPYPFGYDWIEDGMLASVRHIRAGLPLYAPPSVGFTPYLYTPIYLYAAAALSKLTSLGYAPLRWLSLFSTLGCFGTIYALVRREAGLAAKRRNLASLAAVGLFAACYPVVQGTFDLGRVDMLYLFFVLLAFYATRHWNPALAALLWVCAFQTKQGVLPIALLALCYDWPRPRRVLLGVGSFAVLLGVSILWFNHISQGWYRYYVFGLASSFGLVKAQATAFLRADLVRPCGIALLVIVAAWLAAPPRLRSHAFSFYALGSVGMIVFTGYLRAHRGANVNALLPMYAWMAVLFGLALARLLDGLEHRGTPAADAALTLLLLLASLQLAQHLYSPASMLPTAQQIADRESFEQQLRTIPGDVMVLSHPQDGLLAGKPLFAGSESIGAVIDASNRATAAALIAQYDRLLHSGTLSAVVLDERAEDYAELEAEGHPTWMPPDFLALYPLRVAAIGSDQPVFGSEPRWIYLSCGSLGAARALDPGVDAAACSITQLGRISGSSGSR
jgi:hypothetical protein